MSKPSIFGAGLLLVLLGVWSGCVHTPSDPAESAGTGIVEGSDKALVALQRAETLYNEGDYSAALIECVDVAHKDPLTPGLTELRNKIMIALVEQRARRAQLDSEISKSRMTVEALEKEAVPDTYGMRRFVQGETGSLRTPPSAMELVLAKPVTIHLKGVNLSTFIDAIGRDGAINIIADKGVGAKGSIDIEVDDVPLCEVLEYISRNMGITFHVGENVVWATVASPKTGVPMETRIYRLRKGVQFHGDDWGMITEGKVKRPGRLSDLTGEATELSEGSTYIEDTIKRFVSAPAGSDLFLDKNAHVIIAKNTRANLAMIEQIITILDVTPPQILIEARFVETTVSDLRELGIDWILDGPLVTSRRYVPRGDGYRKGHETRIEPGNVINYTPYQTGSEGAFPLGAQGPFALRSEDGNVPTDDQGLNITFQGVLTSPQFKAVLHALDISGKGRTLSVPRVTTVNNNPAKLRNGEDLRYYEEFVGQAFKFLDDNNKRYEVTILVPKGKPSTEETGITLIAVPSVGADLRTISLMLMPTISRIERWTTYQSVGSTNVLQGSSVQQVVVKLPVVSRKEIQTKVIVESGETVVLGGLIDTVVQDTLHTIPFLGQIPLLGRLFERRDVTEQKRNLLVFVTATVISERGETLVPF